MWDQIELTLIQAGFSIQVYIISDCQNNILFSVNLLEYLDVPDSNIRLCVYGGGEQVYLLRNRDCIWIKNSQFNIF